MFQTETSEPLASQVLSSDISTCQIDKSHHSKRSSKNKNLYDPGMENSLITELFYWYSMLFNSTNVATPY
jgi:hypothetical protein